MTIGYYKLSGAGNDFLALVEPARDPSAAEIRAWCRRGLSLGADGLFVLRGAGEGAVVMTHFNADGGRAELCLNGSRCAVRLAVELGWDRDGTVELHTDAGMLEARAAGGNVEIELPTIVGEPEPRALTVGSRDFDGWYLAVGVPHWVLPWPGSLAAAPVAELGPVLRSHPELGAAGANVDFVRYLAPGRLEIRTFERGVEAETLACGSGVVAAVAAGIAAGRLEPPVTALTSGGFELRVGSAAAGGRLEGPTLAGDARILARGEIGDGAAALPPPASWS